MKLKNISQQVMVITGATSGIGLATARAASQRGAKLVLVARNEGALKPLVSELTAKGGDAIYVVADVGDENEVRQVAKAAIDRFGRIDTWINNAGVSIFGTLEQVFDEDSRRLFDTNFWGVVNGSRVAAKHMKEKGGAIINLGSELSDVAIPLQGMYCASKHAVKGFTNALRMELEKDNAPISVTLIKPAAIDTLYVEHAKNYLDHEPTLPPPLYAPEVVTEAILYAAEHPRRDIFVGAAAKFFSAGSYYMPRIVDKVMEKLMFRLQITDKPRSEHEHNALHAPVEELKERQGLSGYEFNSSLYTTATNTLNTAGETALQLWNKRPALLK